jgi:hypothetical protein
MCRSETNNNNNDMFSKKAERAETMEHQDHSHRGLGRQEQKATAACQGQGPHGPKPGQLHLTSVSHAHVKHKNT